MNATEMTTMDVPQTEIVEASPREAVDESQKPRPGMLGDARLRYALLMITVALLGWLAFTVQSATREVESNLDKAYTSMVTGSE